MREYANFTNKPIEFKVWTISAELIKNSHFPMLKSHDISPRLITDSEQVIDWSGASYRYARSRGRVDFDTTCKEQEVVLKLLYGTDLLLLMVTMVPPQHITSMDL